MEKGKLTILIGPNGFGKTKILEDLYEANKGKSIYIPTELKWIDEIKDTTEKPITMDVILNDIILADEEVKIARDKFEKEIKNIVGNNLNKFKVITEKISEFNGIKFNKDNILQQSKKIQYSYLIGLEKNIVKNISSGLGMCFILELLTLSKRNEILLDEPEKFCHPSLLPQIAAYINELLKIGKNVTIATHSPLLVKKLDWDFENLEVINEFEKDDKGKIISNIRKKINISETVSEKEIQEISRLLIANAPPDLKLIGKYISSEETLIKYLQYRKNSIIDLLFSKNLYLIEGENDLLFLNYFLKNSNSGSFIEDYEIIRLYGKFMFPIFISIFNRIKNSQYMQIFSMFDSDNEKLPFHSKTNDYIMKNSSKYLKFDKCLEVDLKFNLVGDKHDCIKFIDFLETQPIDLTKYEFVKNGTSSSTASAEETIDEHAEETIDEHAEETIDEQMNLNPLEYEKK